MRGIDPSRTRGEVRALYIGWRQEEENKGTDAALTYVRRLAPYVHAGYQSALILGTFLLGALFGAFDPRTSFWILIPTALVAIAVFLASIVQDRELNRIEG